MSAFGRTLARTTGVLAASGAACFAYGVLVERHLFTVRRRTVPLLPPGSPDLLVLHLSDVHLVARQRRKLAFLESLRGLSPDLVINTGDNLSSPDAVNALLDALGPLRDVPGAFVFGSNDYTGPSFRNPVRYIFTDTKDRPSRGVALPTAQLREAFTSSGWADLNNARASLDVRGLRLDFRGTDDAHADLEDLSCARGPVDPAADLTIGVTHAPYLRVLDAFVSSGVDIVFAGHTHGGQVCLPGGRTIATNCDIDRRRAKGLSTHLADGRIGMLHVSAGIGSSPFAPYRFACRPEVTLLTLTTRETGL